jgi:hypothetical protein
MSDTGFVQCLRGEIGQKVPTLPSLALKDLIKDKAVANDGNITIGDFIECLRDFKNKIETDGYGLGWAEKKGLKMGLGDLSKKKNVDWWLERLSSDKSDPMSAEFIKGGKAVFDPPKTLRNGKVSSEYGPLVGLKGCLNEELKDIKFTSPTVSPVISPVSATKGNEPEPELEDAMPMRRKGRTAVQAKPGPPSHPRRVITDKERRERTVKMSKGRTRQVAFNKKSAKPTTAKTNAGDLSLLHDREFTYTALGLGRGRKKKRKKKGKTSKKKRRHNTKKSYKKKTKRR